MRALIIKAYESPEITESGKRKLRESYPFLREIFCDDMIDDDIEGEDDGN